jgi:hypothetical protein
LIKKLVALFDLLALFGLLALFVVPAVAQDTQDTAPPQQEQSPTAPTEPVKPKRVYITPKYEISVGYAYRSFYYAGGFNVGMNGLYGSFDYNFRRWIAAEGQILGVAGTGHVPTFPPQSLHVVTALFGPKFTPFGHRKFVPYGHFLYGAGVELNSVPPYGGYAGNSGAIAVRAWEAGGGLDYDRWKHLGIRLIEVDYESAKFLGNGIQGQGSHRVSVGVTYRFGQR